MTFSNFEKIISDDYKVFVDTSSLLQDNSEYIFFSVIAPLLHFHKKKLIIPKSVYNEIYKHSRENKVKNINSGVRILNDFARNDLYMIESKFDNEFADNAIIALFSSLRLRYNLCLITNDNSYKKSGNLSQDILDLKHSRSVYGIRDIVVFYLGRKNEVVQFKSGNRIPSSDKSKQRQPAIIPFELPKSVRINELENKVSYIPRLGDSVLDAVGNKYQLEKQLGRTGGEGTVYITNKKGYVCKVYKIDKNKSFKQEKISLLIKKKINIEGVCLPEFMAYNNHREFVGYFMKMAKGTEVKTSIFIPPLLKKKFPSWTRLHLAILALNILNIVKKLHKYNIILGDINPNNILVKDQFSIYFIDTDSFQLEGYPCSVGMIPYTRIENHGKKYSEYLRNKDDDVFAVMTLVFQILMPGKLPYSFSGGGSEKENMSPKNFPYRCYDGRGYDRAPDGQWVYIWSHLPKKLKELFCKLFKSGEKVSLNDAIKNIESYIYQLKEGYQTDLIFPSSFKRIDEDKNVVSEEISKHKCISCGADYSLTDSEKFFYKGKNLELPKRCKRCRKDKKQERSENKSAYSKSAKSTSQDSSMSDFMDFLKFLF